MLNSLKKNTAFKICIVKLSAMGDIIHTMVALQLIKQSFPYSQIDWLVEDDFKGVLENNPHIDTILPLNLKSIKKNKSEIFTQIKLLNKYAKNNYDIVIDAQGLIKSAIVSKIVGKRVVGSKIIGFDKDSIREGISSCFYDNTVSIGYEKNVIDRNIEVLCKSLDINVTRENLLSKEKFLFSKTSNLSNTNTIIFVIGASKDNKIYPKEHFLEIAQLLNEEIVVVWGNSLEFEVAQWLSGESTLIKTAPKGNLDDLKNTISNAKLVIGADTGPTHMAWALNVPSVIIFGNTPEYRNTYITDINKVIKSNSVVNPLKLDKNDFSICDIKASEIVKIAKELLI
ncbi:lipopolysaccharide heptosyltransferase I [Arcobacteraceae bacterium]|nr:lipopolysaccharide heptosyltransferase I [Arcobacteraceae bacterium]